MEPGLIFTLAAVLSWGFGDFLIQRSIKSTDKIITLFIIQFAGFLILSPFAFSILQNSPSTQDLSETFPPILFTGVVTFFAAMFCFEALKRGKVSVIVPIISMEILVTALFSNLLIGETLSSSQIIFSLFLILGISLISIEDFKHFRNFKIEKGIGFAFLTTLSMGAVNFLFGYTSRLSDPVVVNWGVDFVLSLMAFAFMIFTFRKSLLSIKENPGILLSVAIVDNIAWVSFATAMTLLPIAVVTGISESYIVISALLGIFVNKEKLKHYQYVGLIIVVVSAILLAATV